MTMTPQKIFDKVAAGLLEQGRPAFTDYCEYKTETGERCAIGMLLTGKQLAWAKSINGGIETLMDKAREDDIKLPSFISSGNHNELLIQLQMAHDGPCSCTDDWKELWIHRMETIALEYNLDASIFISEKKKLKKKKKK